MKILMVCLGNICRSPLAEGILKKKIEEKALDWIVDSAGTGFWHIGEKPDPRSIAVARKNGLDITRQRARQFSPADLEDFDLIYAMDQSNLRTILGQARVETQKGKVDLIMNVLSPSQNLNVPDPYWNDAGFNGVFEMLDKACEKIVEKYS